MNMLLRRKRFTFDEFCALVKDGQKADLIDGVIYMASPDSLNANKLAGWLYVLLTFFVQERDLGEVFHSRVAFRLGPRGGPEPDVAFVKKSRRRKLKRGYVAGPPDLAMEVVSPDSVERDYQKKRAQYEKAKVKEYWIVDELKHKITLLILGKNGLYRQVSAKDGILRSKVMPGFWLEESWLWQSPLPSCRKTIEKLLQE